MVSETHSDAVGGRFAHESDTVTPPLDGSSGHSALFGNLPVGTGDEGKHRSWRYESRASAWRGGGQWAASPEPTAIVKVAPAAGMDGRAATIDGAHAVTSQSDASSTIGRSVCPL